LRCVIDTSVLIDLWNGDLLGAVFELEITLIAPTPILDELQEPDRNTLLKLGLEHNIPSIEQLIEGNMMSVNEPQLSLADCSAFIVARDNKWPLLTGDKRLRQKAEDEDLVMHGVLWLMDLIEAKGNVDSQALATSLRKMLDAGARLPAEECEIRFKRWTQS
jgi:predicted nucleic acid-binding protein